MNWNQLHHWFWHFPYQFCSITIFTRMSHLTNYLSWCRTRCKFCLGCITNCSAHCVWRLIKMRLRWILTMSQLWLENTDSQCSPQVFPKCMTAGIINVFFSSSWNFTKNHFDWLYKWSNWSDITASPLLKTSFWRHIKYYFFMRLGFLFKCKFRNKQTFSLMIKK